MANLVCIVLLIFTLTFGKGEDREICSNADISNENDISFEDFTNKVWYIHILIDFRNRLSNNSKLVYQFDITGELLLGYYSGRTKAGTCDLTIFQDLQIGQQRPCMSAKVLVPATLLPPWEWISTMFDDDKTQLMFYTCQDAAKRSNGCDNIVVVGATTRSQLLPGEKELFETKITEFGGEGHVPTGGLPVQLPAGNKCEDPYAKGLGIQA